MHEGVFGGMEPTGREARPLEAGFFTVANGKVVAADFAAEGLGLRVQPGFLPEGFWINPHPEG